MNHFFISNHLIINQQPQYDMTINSGQDVVQYYSPPARKIPVYGAYGIRLENIHGPEKKEGGHSQFPGKREPDHGGHVADDFIHYHLRGIFFPQNFFRLSGQKDGQEDRSDPKDSLEPE
jgi:hypothetical protein